MTTFTTLTLTYISRLTLFMCVSFQTWGLRKLQAFKAPLAPVLIKACKFIQRPEVSDTLVYFNLLDMEDLKKLRDDEDEGEGAGSGGVAKSPIPSLELLQSKSSSQLAQGCLKLLSTLEYSDMKFILRPQQLAAPLGQEEGEEKATPTEGEAIPPGQDSDAEPVVISAHRVIVSARCEWMKRALMSGMREAIDRYVC